MKKERIIYLDVLRVLAIFAVILLHVSALKWNNTDVSSFNWQVYNIYDSIVRFCVPVFIMISGALFLEESKEIKIGRLYKHNIARLIIAFIFWSLCYACFNLFQDIVVNKVSIDRNLFINFIKEILYGHYHLDFLFIIGGLYLVVPLLRKISIDKKMCEYFILLSFIFCYMINIISYIPIINTFVTTIQAKMNINLVLGYTGYFMIGHYLHKYNIKPNTKRLIYLLAILSLIGTIVISSIWAVKTGILNQKLYGYLLPNTFFVSIAVFIFVKEKINKIQFKEKSLKIIQKIAYLTFGIYLVHDFFNIILPKIGLSPTMFNPILSIPIMSVIIFVCSFLVVLIISKIKFLNKYVM